MEEVRGSNRGSYITGSSVHNTRIERLWRDVYVAVSASFVSVFNELENEGILDPLNNLDLFCLHYVFIPRINANLHSFQLAWNNHPLSSENCRSPVDIYMCDSVGSPLFDPLLGDLSGYEDDDDLQLTMPVSFDEISTVEVPEITSPLNSNEMRHLTTLVDPLQESTNNGKDLYISCLDIVYHLLQDH